MRDGTGSVLARHLLGWCPTHNSIASGARHRHTAVVDDAEPGPATPAITFRRLTDVPLPEVRALLNEPRNSRHMPLAGEFSGDATTRWVRDKDAQWDAAGYGPEAVYVDGELAGWGGYQREDAGADLALVLAPRYWGLGERVARLLLDRGFGQMGLDEVVVALPRSRGPARVLERFGFRADGTTTHGGVESRLFRLSRAAWAVATEGRT
jgi:[ribosomal protein S5]-alanine N-acetyltransferase